MFKCAIIGVSGGRASALAAAYEHVKGGKLAANDAPLTCPVNPAMAQSITCERLCSASEQDKDTCLGNSLNKTSVDILMENARN